MPLEINSITTALTNPVPEVLAIPITRLSSLIPLAFIKASATAALLPAGPDLFSECSYNYSLTNLIGQTKACSRKGLVNKQISCSQAFYMINQRKGNVVLYIYCYTLINMNFHAIIII